MGLEGVDDVEGVIVIGVDEEATDHATENLSQHVDRDLLPGEASEDGEDQSDLGSISSA